MSQSHSKRAHWLSLARVLAGGTATATAAARALAPTEHCDSSRAVRSVLLEGWVHREDKKKKFARKYLRIVSDTMQGSVRIYLLWTEDDSDIDSLSPVRIPRVSLNRHITLPRREHGFRFNECRRLSLHPFP